MARVRRGQTEVQETSYWQSYSDMMAGVLLMFILIICGTLFVLMQVKNNLDEDELKLQDTVAQLEDKNAQLEDTVTVLEQTILDRDEYATLSEDQETELAAQRALLAAQEEALRASEEMLVLKDTELDEKEAQISLQRDELAAQQLQLEMIIGVKREIVESLRDEFASADISISVDDQTGAITLESSVLFEYNASTLSEEGERALAEIMPLYLGVVLSDEYIENVAEIVIEGHTDTQGGYDYNMELSQSRAAAVASFCIGDEQTILSADMAALARTYVSAAGRSWTNPVYRSDGTVDADASRRVEIKFRLKDEDMVDELLDVLDSYDG